jgi:hypothetical protein
VITGTIADTVRLQANATNGAHRKIYDADSVIALCWRLKSMRDAPFLTSAGPLRRAQREPVECERSLGLCQHTAQDARSRLPRNCVKRNYDGLWMLPPYCANFPGER